MILDRLKLKRLNRVIEPNQYWKNKCNELNIDGQKIDWTSLQQQERDYSKQEFKNVVLEEIKKHSNIILATIEKIPKQELEYITQEAEQKELLEQEQKAEQRELELIEQIKQSKTPELDKYYKDLDIYLKVLENTPTITACVIIGDAGIGKSTYIKKRFKGDTILLSGHLTAKELYLTYLEHPNSHIIIDDPSSIYANVDSLGLLLQATQTEPIRTIHWHTSTLKVPKKTTFFGKTTLIQNYDLKDLMLENRCLIKYLHFEFDTKIKMLYEFAKIINCPMEIVDEVSKFRNYGEIINRKISFRTIQKLFAFYNNDKGWKGKILEIIGIKEDKSKIYDLVLELDKKYISIKDMEEDFIKQTKMSRAQFYLLRNELGLTRIYTKKFK